MSGVSVVAAANWIGTRGVPAQTFSVNRGRGTVDDGQTRRRRTVVFIRQPIRSCRNRELWFETVGGRVSKLSVHVKMPPYIGVGKRRRNIACFQIEELKVQIMRGESLHSLSTSSDGWTKRKYFHIARYMMTFFCFYIFMNLIICTNNYEIATQLLFGLTSTFKILATAPSPLS